MDRPAALLCLAVLVALAATALCYPRPAPVVTPEQYEKSLKMLRNVCQPKTGIPADMLERMKGGEFVQDEKAYCYTACFLQTMMVLKNNKVDSKMFKMQVKKMMLPDAAARVINAFTECEGTPAGAEPCETTGLFINCVEKVDPTFNVPA
uniref:Odorant binding protein n=1 Tax=Frankliniella occidentalis TaxID=133901 RepID=A0A0F6SKM5_FRAOC|nr:odorant binding protein [Frankliniella occidentalis]